MCLRMHWGLQHEREVWRENGLAPPMPGTDAEKYWIEVDKAVPYTKVCCLLCRALAVICKQRSPAANLFSTHCLTGGHRLSPGQGCMCTHVLSFLSDNHAIRSTICSPAHLADASMISWPYTTYRWS